MIVIDLDIAGRDRNDERNDNVGFCHDRFIGFDLGVPLLLQAQAMMLAKPVQPVVVGFDRRPR
mgnify:CR=1 FL=1